MKEHVSRNIKLFWANNVNCGNKNFFLQFLGFICEALHLNERKTAEATTVPSTFSQLFELELNSLPVVHQLQAKLHKVLLVQSNDAFLLFF